jgi:hypothetical protein
MSRQFTGRAGAELCIGTPPNESRSALLSRKVQSELNLAKLVRVRTNTAESVATSNTSGFSADSSDPLPDEATPSQALAEVTVDCDAINALREVCRPLTTFTERALIAYLQLGALVARRRGLDAGTFVKGVMTLLAEGHDCKGGMGDDKLPHTELKPPEMRSSRNKSIVDESTPIQTLRRFQSQPQLNSDQKRRRHFSFEPGEDFIQSLKEGLTPGDTLSPSGLPSERVSPVSDDLRDNNTPSLSGGFTSSCDSSDCDMPHTSKIPSPIHAFGSIRRRTSISSMQTVMVRSNDGRHNSESSIVTTYHSKRHNNSRTGSSSRSSSNINLRRAEPSPSSKNHTNSIRVGSSVVGLVTEQANRTTASRGNSPAKSKTELVGAVSSPRTRCDVGHVTSENDEPSASG